MYNDLLILCDIIIIIIIIIIKHDVIKHIVS